MLRTRENSRNVVGQLSPVPLVLAIGELLWDELPSGRMCGGAAGNYIYHAKRAGANALLISSVGFDKDGESLLSALSAKGVDVRFVTRNEFPTGRVSVKLNGAIPEYTIHEPAAWDHISLTEESRKAAAGADAVCFGTLAQRNADSRETIQEVLRLAAGARFRILDVNLRQNFYGHEILERSLWSANVLKLNDDELPVLARMFGFPDAGEAAVVPLMEKFELDYCIYTQGAFGSILFDRTARLEFPCGEGPVVDTVGCGDAFTAAWTCAMLEGNSTEEAMVRATRTATWIAGRAGAMPDGD